MIFRKLFFIILASVAFFASCDVPYDYLYQVSNNTDTVITIIYKYGTDSTITISAQTTLPIKRRSTIEGPGGPYKSDITYAFDSFTVYIGNKLSKKDYMVTDNWGFEKKSSNLGVYTAEVSTSDF